MTTILTIGIEPSTQMFLKNKGFMLTSHTACSKTRLCELASSGDHELAVLGSTSALGPGAVSRLREQQIPLPAIQILQGPRDQAWSRRCVEFLDAGGDDVIAGPSRPEEVAYSVFSLLRRVASSRPEIYQFELGNELLLINASRAQVKVNGQVTEFTGNELRFLLSLARRGNVVSRDALTTDLYDGDGRVGNCIEVFAARIRNKLQSARPMLVTHRGVGYALAGRVA